MGGGTNVGDGNFGPGLFVDRGEVASTLIGALARTDMASFPKLDANTESTMQQFKEFLLSYNKLSEACFMDCAHDFTTRKVLESEQNCANNCMEKYMKITQRISQRFQEYQVQMQEGNLAPGVAPR